ncbi:hypothetical protein RchiOBHm_Chr2g0145461 [Rosa chinensis]|uniref:Uncharacterized protein n=1 Tax=Rosa chinensis TaxID=74649 RepID=A0A2P6RYN9_ROSCH|nr:hypothetical protein RchiOBHm_Chr2g0145461 [Rosa chinensis]
MMPLDLLGETLEQMIKRIYHPRYPIQAQFGMLSQSGILNLIGMWKILLNCQGHQMT